MADKYMWAVFVIAIGSALLIVFGLGYWLFQIERTLNGIYRKLPEQSRFAGYDRISNG